MRKYYIKLVKIAGFISNLNGLHNCIEYQSINLDMPENVFIFFSSLMHSWTVCIKT